MAANPRAASGNPIQQKPASPKGLAPGGLPCWPSWRPRDWSGWCCWGGARLAASLLALDLVDGIQLTLVPRLLGGGHGWLPLAPLPAPGPWALEESRPLGQGELLLRYGRPSPKDHKPSP